MDGNVTSHFSWGELACHDGTPVPPELVPDMIRVCTVAERIRGRFGLPLVVVSGYRTEAYNRRIGGAQHSQHVLGTALDLRPVALEDLPRLIALVEEMLHDRELEEVGGFGTYSHWIHVDVRARRADGTIARWTGNGVGSEAA